MRRIHTDLFELFFPRYCAGCQNQLHHFENALCLHCLMMLPRASIHQLRENKLERLFWGRADVAMATAFLRMSRKGLTHRLVHELKYEGNKEIGQLLGTLFGQELSKIEVWKTVDLIVPVPLHPKKEQLRGYNQSYEIASGVSESMAVPTTKTAIKRKQFTETQTKKLRVERWKNVSDIFEINDSELANKQHILLVDDVITTGATIESCVLALTNNTSIKVSVAALAMPVR
jgi:ComF family protein